MDQLTTFWSRNKEFNDAVKSVRSEVHNWSEVYALGLMEELGQLLKEIHWKKHRRTSSDNVENISYELADIVAYAICLCQEYDISQETLLDALVLKNETVKSRFIREFFPVKNGRVIVIDLDGTVADFRKGFHEWFGVSDSTKSLSFDVDNHIPFKEYEVAKNEFEKQGGYAQLPAYEDAIALLLNEQRKGAQILVTTARPFGSVRRVERDTWQWLRKYGLNPSSVIFGRDERILALLELASANQVILLEDDAALASRAAANGVTVWLRDQPYNQGVDGETVYRFKEFPKEVIWNEQGSTISSGSRSSQKVI